MLARLREFLGEAPNYRGWTVDENKTRRLLENNLTNATFFCQIVVQGSETIGGLCSVATEFIINHDTVADDLLLFVANDERERDVAFQLVTSYVEWAKVRKVRRALISDTTGNEDRISKLVAKAGFRELGRIYALDIGV
jgi:hypothetical protein